MPAPMKRLVLGSRDVEQHAQRARGDRRGVRAARDEPDDALKAEGADPAFEAEAAGDEHPRVVVPEHREQGLDLTSNRDATLEVLGESGCGRRRDQGKGDGCDEGALEHDDSAGVDAFAPGVQRAKARLCANLRWFYAEVALEAATAARRCCPGSFRRSGRRKATHSVGSGGPDDPPPHPDTIEIFWRLRA